MQAGLDLQDGFEADEEMPELRIGLATGLVINRMGDIFGTTVNMASRLTSLARPGTVVVDRATADDLRDDDRFSAAALWPRPVRGLGMVEPYVVTRRSHASPYLP